VTVVIIGPWVVHHFVVILYMARVTCDVINILISLRQIDYGNGLLFSIVDGFIRFDF
jgi:hypothetical protein